ncbi:(2Fe-2S)-binding protein [Roseomonas sp. BU-1]|uniref:(2Fe-2S)-binding protein n=1 Tax=Falsiroseomonas selenitidurans TaxID=2716335 RepID=A0ABX1E4N8_9PROT|nr:(2Fe-2S)-binding protein [Falsiroseomonas selenitidurans]
MGFTLNGAAVAAPIEAEAPLLAALRGPLGLSGTRFGCGAEQCGACLVLLDGQPRHACTLPVGEVAGRDVTTVEGIGTAAAPHPLQKALLDQQAGQCGFCLSGIQIRALALLRATPRPTEVEIRAALDPHLCRCGSHNRIIRAIQQAAAEMAP